jgi:hypothetical protein
MDANLHQDVFRGILSIFNKYIVVAVFVEDAGVEQLVFETFLAALAVGLD